MKNVKVKKNTLNSKRNREQIYNSLSDQSSNDEKYQTKKYSTRGRPVKHDVQMKLYEQDIKKNSWDFGKLDSYLYQNLKGSEKRNDKQTQLSSEKIILQYFGDTCLLNFKDMIQHSKDAIQSNIDPINLELIPLSILYYIDRFLKNNNNQTIKLSSFLLFFLYYMYDKISESKFQVITQIFSVICEKLTYSIKQNNGEEKLQINNIDIVHTNDHKININKQSMMTDENNTKNEYIKYEKEEQGDKKESNEGKKIKEQEQSERIDQNDKSEEYVIKQKVNMIDQNTINDEKKSKEQVAIEKIEEHNCNECEQDEFKNKINIKTQLKPSVIFKIVDICDEMKQLYELLYPIILDSFQYFSSKNNQFSIIASN